MLEKLPKDNAGPARTGRWIGTIHLPDTSQDVGYCILWSDGVYEICLDRSASLRQMAALKISPRSCNDTPSFIGGENTDRACTSTAFLPVTILKDHRVKVSVLDKFGRAKEIQL